MWIQHMSVHVQILPRSDHGLVAALELGGLIQITGRLKRFTPHTGTCVRSK